MIQKKASRKVTQEGSSQRHKYLNPDKRKTFCLGVEIQSAQPNPETRTKQSTAPTKLPLNNITEDKFTRKPADEKWNADMLRVETALETTATISPDLPTAPPRQKGA